VYQLEQ